MSCLTLKLINFLNKNTIVCFIVIIVFGFTTTECSLKGTQEGKNLDTSNDTLITSNNLLDTISLKKFTYRFLDWFAATSQADDTLPSHILKLVSSHADSVFRIDSQGCKNYIAKYYLSGFFTKEWKNNALKSLLLIDDWLLKHPCGEIDCLEDLDFPGDPALGLGNHGDWFYNGLRDWKVNDFKLIKNGIFEEKLVCHVMIEDKSDDAFWTVQIVRNGVNLEINKVIGPTRESDKK